MSLVFTTALVEDFEELLESADDYDISIQAGKEINSKLFRAHTNILKARSNYFKKALSHNYHEGKHETPLVIVIENITPAAFEAILNVNTALQKHLIIHEAAWIKSQFSHVRHIASQKNYKSILSFCNDLAKYDPTVVFKAADFMQLDKDLLVNILEQDYIGTTEVEAWGKVVAWGKHRTAGLPEDMKDWQQCHFEALKSTIEDCIPLIRFFQFTAAEFNDHVIPYDGLLPKELFKDLMGYFLKPNYTPKSSILPARTGHRWLSFLARLMMIRVKRQDRTQEEEIEEISDNWLDIAESLGMFENKNITGVWEESIHVQNQEAIQEQTNEQAHKQAHEQTQKNEILVTPEEENHSLGRVWVISEEENQALGRGWITLEEENHWKAST
ncbi:1761_t:CDS:2 [Paraglomus occultum]|uniref:1761_t:CDS:1 n=1 Tax=Paraglomus occultum TaxID=144539 RepID=A0A9N8WBW7_9GLOM|nr:1761_t:CDS:2 [Paraglomus occultum]